MPFTKPLEDEIAERLQIANEDSDEMVTREQIILEFMQDMDDRDSIARQFRNELRDHAIAAGIYKAHTKADLDNIIVSGGRKYDFKRGDTYYIFDSWK